MDQRVPRKSKSARLIEMNTLWNDEDGGDGGDGRDGVPRFFLSTHAIYLFLFLLYSFVQARHLIQHYARRLADWAGLSRFVNSFHSLQMKPNMVTG